MADEPDNRWQALDTLPDEPLKQVALLAASPPELAQQVGLTFHIDTDDFGKYTWSAVEVDGAPFVFMRYAQSPEAGTVLYGRDDAEPVAKAMNLPDSWRPGTWDTSS